MTPAEFQMLQPGTRVKFTGMHGGAPVQFVSAGDKGEVKSRPRYFQAINKFEVKITVDSSPSGPAHTVYVVEPDSIEFESVSTANLQPLLPFISTIQEVEATDNHLSEPKKIKCECGAAAIGIKLHTPGHSTWCPGR